MEHSQVAEEREEEGYLLATKCVLTLFSFGQFLDT